MYMYDFAHFLSAHLSGWLKWAFSDQNFLLSVIVIVINFSHFRLHLENHSPNFNQTWHKAFLGEGDMSLLKWKATPIFKGR